MADLSGSFSGSIEALDYSGLTVYSGSTFGFFLHQRLGTDVERVDVGDFYTTYLESDPFPVYTAPSGGRDLDHYIIVRSGSDAIRVTPLKDIFGGYTERVDVNNRHTVHVYAKGAGRGSGTNQNTWGVGVLTVAGETIYDFWNGEGRDSGLTLTILDGNDFSVVSTTNYDTTLNSTNANNLATALAGMTPQEIGIITSLGYWEAFVTDGLKDSGSYVGLTKLKGVITTNSGSAYAAVFYGGSGSIASNHDAIERMVTHGLGTGSVDIPQATLSVRLQNNKQSDYDFPIIDGAYSTNALWAPGATGEPTLWIDANGTLQGDYALSGSVEDAVSASYALTASYALNAGAGGSGGSGIFEQTGSFYATTNDLQITGSLDVTNGITGSFDYDNLVNVPFGLISSSGQISYTGITDVPSGIVSSSGQVVHSSTSGYVADQHVAHSGVTLTAGAGLTGGGTIEASRTFNVGAGSGISVAADSVSVDGTVLRTTGGGIVSSSLQFNNLSSPLTGSFTGSFVGDGSGLTGITLTINNDANDRVTTAQGDGDLNAESTLTYNGAGNLIVGDGVSTNTAAVQIGASRTDIGYALLDLIGDTTYTDYGLRLIRGNAGQDTNSLIQHRGTGSLRLITVDAGDMWFSTNNTQRMLIDSAGDVTINNVLNVRGAIDLADNDILRFGTGDDVELFFNASDFYTDLNAGSWYIRNGATNVAIFEAAGDNLGVGTGITETITDSTLHVYDNNASTDSTVGLTIEQDGTGDVILHFLLSGVKRWVMGLDNDDNDRFKISENDGLGTTTALAIDAGGRVELSSGWSTPTETGNGGDQWYHVAQPEGAYFSTGNGTLTGAIEIQMPAANLHNNTMMMFYIDIFNYSENETQTILVGGYNYNGGAGSPEWFNTSAVSLGGNRDLNVRFGHDGIRNIIWIGETSTVWNYTKVRVRDFMGGWNNTVEDWATGWNITTTTTFDTVDVNQGSNRVVDTDNYGAVLNGGTINDFNFQTLDVTTRLSVGTNPALEGDIRIPNGVANGIYARNNGNTNSHPLIYLDTADDVNVSETGIPVVLNENTTIDGTLNIVGTAECDDQFKIEGNGTTPELWLRDTGTTADWYVRHDGTDLQIVRESTKHSEFVVSGGDEYLLIGQTTGVSTPALATGTTSNAILCVGDHDSEETGWISLGKGFDVDSGISWFRGTTEDSRIYLNSSEQMIFENDISNSLSNSHFYWRANGGSNVMILTDTGQLTVYGNLIPDTDNTGNVGTSTNTWNNGQFTNFTVNSTLNVRGAIDLADNDVLRFGSGDDWEFFHNGTNNYMDLNVGDFIIRDNTTNRFTFSRTGGTGTATDWIATSDIRLKDVQGPVIYGLEEIKKIDPITYTWKDKRDESEHLGFSAQDVEKIIPEVVRQTEDGQYGLAYDKLVPVLVNAIKELSAQNNLLMDRLNRIEERLDVGQS